MQLAVVMLGPDGRMGKIAGAMLRESESFDVVAEVRREDPLAESLARAASEKGARVGLDLTIAGLGALHGHAMLEAGLRPVIGTSGVTAAEVESLDSHARELGLGGLVVPNFSLGIVAMQRMLLVAQDFFAKAEIIEAHHDRKRDVPSGTALDIQRRLAARWEADPGKIPIHSVRLPGISAQHEVILARDGETLSVRHGAPGPAAYLPGIRLALEFSAKASGITCGLDAVLGSLPGKA